jgi:glycerate kinase
MEMTTLGLGELILDAIKRGCRDFIIGLGGSATHDVGLGMLSALGFRFMDAGGNPLAPCGRSLIHVAHIDAGAVDPRIFQCSFRVACDVRNPLLGEFGAARVYGPQKGAAPDAVEELERGTKHFAETVTEKLGRDHAACPGAGAAGGLGYAFLAFLAARIERGIDIVLEMADMEAEIIGADFVVTGEGKIDFQTAMGKGPIGVARLAQKHGAAVVAFAGCTTDDADVCNGEGIDAYFSILRAPTDIYTAMKKEEAMGNLSSSARQVFRLIAKVQERCDRQ